MKEKVENKAGVFFLENKILIQTMFKKNEGVWYGSDKVSIIPVEISDFLLGEFILNSLNNSKHIDTSNEQIKKNWKLVIKKSNVKTEKMFFEKARYMAVVLNNSILKFSPYRTSVSRRIFAGTPDKNYEFEFNSNIELVGQRVRYGMSLCEFIE